MSGALIDIADFRRGARLGAAPREAVTAMSARAVGPVVGANDRIFRFCFSDASLDRAGDTINPEGWDLMAYRRNPVVLWAHDALAPPIGRTSGLFADHRGLFGDVEFAAPEVYDFADVVFRLVRAGYLKAGSVGFLPIDWTFAKDEGREFGIDFVRQELLEFSICPVPANSNALVEAATKGLITRRAASLAAARFESAGAIQRAARLRRLAASDAQEGRPPAQQSGRLPSRAGLRLQFAGTLVDRDREIDRSYPGLRRQELEDELAAAREARSLWDTPARRLAVANCMRRLSEV
jgi:HK97 family phage prohead protease